MTTMTTSTRPSLYHPVRLRADDTLSGHCRCADHYRQRRRTKRGLQRHDSCATRRRQSGNDEGAAAPDRVSVRCGYLGRHAG